MLKLQLFLEGAIFTPIFKILVRALILLYKGLKGKAKIPTDDLIPKTRHGRNQHSLAFQIPSASKDVYMCIASSPRLSGTGMTSLNP